MNLTIKLIVMSILMINPTFSNSKLSSLEKKTDVELENELIDFSTIRDELKKDGLESSAKVFKESVKKVKTKRIKKLQKSYSYPKENDFWKFFSELWLVRNAELLKWDFQKPDYGLLNSFKNFLEKFGFYNNVVKILYVNSPNLSHMALPSSEGESIFIISVPFIRTLDLSKLEISILMFEDFLRLRAKYFIKNASSKELTNLLGKSFYKNKMNTKAFKQISKSYDEIIFTKGFNFQQQFNITKLMSSYLINDMKIWNTYYKLLGKIDLLVKSNIMYKKYTKIYPSPELQLNWLRPKTKKR